MHIKPFHRLCGFLIVVIMLSACTAMRPIEPIPLEVKQHFTQKFLRAKTFA